MEGEIRVPPPDPEAKKRKRTALKPELHGQKKPVDGQPEIFDSDIGKYVPGNPTLTANHGPSQHTEGNAWKVTYQDASGDETELSLGADGTVLTSTGAASAPAFETGSGHAHTHAETTGKTTDDHHAQSHGHTGADSSGTVAHSDTTGRTANDHHNEAHTVASHSDTTATGAELEELTDGSTTALHAHTGGGVTDHGALTGLADDDHAQYLLASGARTITEALKQTERAAAPADVAGEGQWWTKSNTPNQGMFTDDLGNDMAMGNQTFALTLKDATTHATEPKVTMPFRGGPALQTTANWNAKAYAVDAVTLTNTFEVHTLTSGGVDNTVATITITAGNRFGAASSAFALGDDLLIYILHTGGDNTGLIYSIGFKRV